MNRLEEALIHALILEIDGDFLASLKTIDMQRYIDRDLFASLTTIDMQRYVIECRHVLKEKYDLVPYPFNIDNYWDD